MTFKVQTRSQCVTSFYNVQNARAVCGTIDNSQNTSSQFPTPDCHQAHFYLSAKHEHLLLHTIKKFEVNVSLENLKPLNIYVIITFKCSFFLKVCA